LFVVVFVCLFFPFRGGRFLMPVFGVFVLVSDFSDSDSACLLMGCFCLESLILAQDERWRRA
jgi:hypothetical protein